jgi:hypothetical protein
LPAGCSVFVSDDVDDNDGGGDECIFDHSVTDAATPAAVYER